jgi:hypothetical protein
METTRSITNAEELKEAIRFLEQKKVAEQELLKEEFYYTKEKLKPANVVKTTFNQVFTGPNFIRTALLTGAGITAGYITKKYFRGLTGRILKRLLGRIV